MTLPAEIFGAGASSMGTLLAACPNLVTGLALAGQWWSAASSQGTLDSWRGKITSAASVFLALHCADDLFSESSNDKASSLLEIVGFAAVVSPSAGMSGRKPFPTLGLSPSRGRAALPLDFFLAILRSDPTAAGHTLALMGEPFRVYRLDRLLRPDCVSEATWTALRDKTNKHLCSVVGAALETEALASRPFDGPGPMERSSALATTLLGPSACVPFNAIPWMGAPSSSPSALTYFSGLPSWPKPTLASVREQRSMIRGNLLMLHDLTAQLLQRTLTITEHREGVLAWISRAVTLSLANLSASGHRGLMEDDEKSSHGLAASSGFLLNLASVLLLLVKPLTDDPTKFVPKIEVAYLSCDWRVPFSTLPKLAEGTGEGAPLLSRSGGESGAAGSRSRSCSEDEATAEDEEMLAAALAMSMAPHADPGFFPRGEQGKFTFVTEIFFLTSRAMELVHKLFLRRDEQLRRAHRMLSDAKHHAASSPPGSSDYRVAHFESCYMTLVQAWDASQLGDPAFLAKACYWARFASEWLRSLAKGRFKLVAEDATAVKAAALDGDDAASPAAIVAQFRLVPAGLVKAMCEIWSHACVFAGDEAEGVMPGLMAADAALFCCEFMDRPDLVTSPVVQDRLLTVVDAFIQTAPQGGRESTGVGSPVYFGTRRGLAGAVMDNQRIREELAPALMRLYGSCHAVEGLDVDEDVSFDKFHIRHRINNLLQHLFFHPLREPKTSILSFAASSMFETFLIAAYDTIMYNFEDALLRIRDTRQAERSGKAPSKQQQGTATAFLARSNSTFDLLNVLCREPPVRAAVAAMHVRTGATLWSCLNSLTAPDFAANLEGTPEAKEGQRFGLILSDALSRPAQLLAHALEDPASGASVAAAVVQHPDFDPSMVAVICKSPGGECLRPFVEILQHASTSSLADGVSLSGEVDFASWLRADEDNGQSFEDAYEAAVSEAGQVAEAEGGFKGGHYFMTEHAKAASGGGGGGGGGGNTKHLMKEYRKLMKGQLPSPHPNATILVRWDADRPAYARAVVTGPADTPYFGGAFVFDVFFPDSYPSVPPLVQLVTTGRGTIRFNPNLYSDGKVCLSVLGTWHGDASEKWDPAVSSLYQVLLSIQTQILVAAPYFNEPGNEGKRRTPQGCASSAAMNEDLQLQTVRHACVAVMKDCAAGLYPELELALSAHFVKISGRFLASLEAPCASPSAVKLRRGVVELKALVDHLKSPQTGPLAKKSRTDSEALSSS